MLIAISIPELTQASSKVFYIQGEAVQGEKKIKAVGEILEEKVVISTQSDSILGIEFKDGSRVKIPPSSRVKILKSAGEVELQLVRGRIFSKVKKSEVSDKSHFKIRSQSAVMGVRGTEFFASVDEQSHDLWMCVNEGKVEISSEGTAKPILVPAGLGVFAPTGKLITEPKPFAWTKKLNWNMDPSQGEIQDETVIPKYSANLLKQQYD